MKKMAFSSHVNFCKFEFYRAKALWRKAFAILRKIAALLTWQSFFITALTFNT